MEERETQPVATRPPLHPPPFWEAVNVPHGKQIDLDLGLEIWASFIGCRKSVSFLKRGGQMKVLRAAGQILIFSCICGISLQLLQLSTVQKA